MGPAGRTSVLNAPLAPGTPGQLAGGTVGRYQVLAMAGAGGMGEVYSGHDPVLDRPVAIKRLHPEDVLDRQRARRLRTEAQLHGRLLHPNIVRVYDLVSQDGADHIISEYVDGESLRQLTQRTRLPFRRALEIIRDVARGLAFAHDNGIVHRDLKTENVLIGSDGSAKIIDFGLSRSLSSPGVTGTRSTEDGGLLGTFTSMSPEQSLGTEVDARSDLFSFGIMIYEVMAGRSPFEADTVYEIVTNIRTKQQVALAECAPEVPIELSLLVDRLLCKLPDDRPSTAVYVEQTLSRLLTELMASQRSAADSTRRQQVSVGHLCVRLYGTSGEDGEIFSFHRLVRQSVQQHHASLVYAAGDEVLFCMGYPEVHENNTRLAAELLFDILAQLSLDDDGAKLDVSAALDVGEVTAHQAGASPLLLGRPVRRAMVLGRAADPRQLLVTSDAQIALTRFYHLEPHHGLPGGSELPLCYSLIGERSIERTGTAFVGRDHELAVLERDWGLVSKQPGRGRVLAIEGEAGIGKSRLLYQFTTDPRFTGRYLFMRGTLGGRFTAFAPVRRLLEQLPELRREGSAPTREDIARLGSDEICAAVAHVLDLATDGDRDIVARLQERDGASALSKTLAGFFLGMAEDHPLLLVVDDAHWMDHSSRQMLDEIVGHADRLQVYLVVTHRPEYKPAWEADRFTRMVLDRLTDDQSERIISDCSGTVSVAAPLKEKVLAQALGVPLWLEELTSSVVDQIQVGQSLSATDRATVPTTLRDLVQSRLETVGPQARETAELLAAIGREIPTEIVFAVEGRSHGGRKADIESLKQKGLIQQRGLVKNPQLVFRHALMRDAIYEALEPQRRRRLHRAIAAALHDKFAQLESEQPELFAHHHEQSGRLREALGFWHRAGVRAAKMWSHDLACQHYKRALRLLERLPDDAERLNLERACRQDYRRSLQIVEGLWASELEENNARLITIADASAPSAQDLWMAFLQGYLLCNVAQIDAVLAQLEAQQDDPPMRYVLGTSRGMAYLHLGRWSEARRALVSALELREAVLETILAEFTEHTVTVAPAAYLSWLEMLTGNAEAAWNYQLAEERAFADGTPIHLNVLAFGTVVGGIMENHEPTLLRAERVINEGEGVLAAGHVHVARYFRLYLELKQRMKAGGGARAQTAQDLEALWQHFLGWHAGFLRASSIIYCALTADVAVDVLRLADASDALRAAAAAQAHASVRWGLDCLSDSGADEMHRYFSSELYRAIGRLARAEGDEGAAKAAFAEARVRCERLIERGAEVPQFLIDRITRSASQAGR
jgi:hypothetical protein